MNPVIALVGRPNVGKSTLFNRLTASRAALVSDFPGLTRDRHYGSARVDGRSCIVIDTGGLTGEQRGLEALMATQAMQAVEEADHVLFLVDARAGLNAADESIGQQLRTAGKSVSLVVNKAEHLNPEIAATEFATLGIGDIHCISSSHGIGVSAMIEAVLADLRTARAESQEAGHETADAGLPTDAGIRVAIVGRPNVGKSTLVNRILGEERMLAFDEPGTTRDSIFLPFVRDEQAYTLIDTAGVRRRSRVHETIEKFSIVKTLQAIEAAHVVLLVLDARQGIGEQDARLLGYAIESGRALVIAVNKWDGLEVSDRSAIRSTLERKLSFINYAQVHFISALHGSGVGDLFSSIQTAYHAGNKSLSTPKLTRMLQDAVERHAPPLVRGRRIKLRYAHQGGHNPPVIVIHGSQTQAVPDNYRRYLEAWFRDGLDLMGTPVRIEFKTGENPYKDRRRPVRKPRLGGPKGKGRPRRRER